jgi:hypothetical protein
VHSPDEGLPRTIEQPNSYPPQGQGELGFPFIVPSHELMRTVIVRLGGPVDEDAEYLDPDADYLLTEDDYIDFLGGSPVEEIVPAQILGKLRRANYLFLGYPIIPWRLRVFLRRVWGGSRLGRQKYWAIEREPDPLASELWNAAGVTLYQSSLTDYLRGLHSFIEFHADELAP